MANLTKSLDALNTRVAALEGKGGATDANDPGPGDGNPNPQDDDPAGTNKGDGAVLETAAGKSAPAAMDAKAMDAVVEKRLRESQQQIVAKTSLAEKVSHFVGTFDHSLMLTEAEVAAYGCTKLEIKASKGQELAALNGYLHGRTPPAKQPAAAMDTSGSADWLTKQLA